VVGDGLFDVDHVDGWRGTAIKGRDKGSATFVCLYDKNDQLVIPPDSPGR
jgi:hypothetical protein